MGSLYELSQSNDFSNSINSQLRHYYCYADERAQKAVETRQGLLKVVGHYFGPIVAWPRAKCSMRI